MRVYCDNGVDQTWLRKINSSKQLDIVVFPYEMKNKLVTEIPQPSNLTWNQAEAINLTWDSSEYMWNDLGHSEKFNELEKILKLTGAHKGVDIQHLDTAYKSKCDVFLTTDYTDIVSKREELELLLKIRIFDTNHERLQFQNYMKVHE